MARQDNLIPFVLLGAGLFFLFRKPTQKPTSTSTLPGRPVVTEGRTIIQSGTSEFAKWVQRSLNQIFPDANLNVDGVIGPITKSWIVKFQEIWGLTPDGVVGPMTEYALHAALGTPGYTEQPYTASPSNEYEEYEYY